MMKREKKGGAQPPGKGSENMHYLPKPGYRRIAVLALYAGLGAGLLYLFFRYLSKPLLPFFIAFAVALILQRPMAWLTSKSRLSRGIFAAVLVLLLAGASILVCYAVVGSLFQLLRELVTQLTDEASELSLSFAALRERLRVFFDGLPFFSAGQGDGLLSALLQQAEPVAQNALRAVTEELSARLPGAVAVLASALPRGFLFLVVTVVASVYMTADYPRFISFLKNMLPFGARRGAADVRHRICVVLLHYLRAYGLILLMTFGELWVGFLLLGIRNSAAPALLIALFDILPIVGTGTVLLPWSLSALIRGQVTQGVGILILYLVIAVVRQIAEPRIVGRSIGQYPLLTLASMYVGLRLFGFFGLFLVPVTVNLLLGLWKEGKLGVYAPGKEAGSP